MPRTIDIRQSETTDIHLKDVNTTEIRISQLINDKACLNFLEQFKEDITAPNIAVAASLFMKRYARLVASPTLQSVGADNCALSLSVQACFFTNDKKLRVEEDFCQWRIWEPWEREEMRDIIFRELFAYHLTPVISVLERTTPLKAAVLWENVAVRVNSVYRKALLKDKNEKNHTRMISDFDFLKEASGELFSLDRNPLSPYLHLETDGSAPYRQTCCMYYRLKEDKEGIGFCGNCPCRKKLEH